MDFSVGHLDDLGADHAVVFGVMCQTSPARTVSPIAVWIVIKWGFLRRMS